MVNMKKDRVHIAMVGSAVEPVISGAINKGATDIYPIISEKFWPEKFDELKNRLSASVCIHDKVNNKLLKVDPFRDESFIEILEMIIDIVQFHPSKDSEFFINLTGGTKLMSAVAEAGAVLTKSQAYYVVNPEENVKNKRRESVIDLPWHSMIPLELDNSRVLILKCLNDHPSGLSNKRIVGLYPNEFTSRKITYHLKDLKKTGYITREREGRYTINKIAPWGKIALRIAEMNKILE